MGIRSQSADVEAPKRGKRGIWIAIRQEPGVPKRWRMAETLSYVNGADLLLKRDLQIREQIEVMASIELPSQKGPRSWLLRQEHSERMRRACGRPETRAKLGAHGQSGGDDLSCLGRDAPSVPRPEQHDVRRTRYSRLRSMGFQTGRIVPQLPG